MSDDQRDSADRLSVERRGFLKAAGLGIAATAGAVATASPAVAQLERIDAPIDPIIAPPRVAVPIPLQDAEILCGSVSSTRLPDNTIEITVPAGRQVIIRELPAVAIPLGEVVVNISRDIALGSDRGGLVMGPIIPPA